MTKIYDQHDAAFRNVSAFTVSKDGERVASIAFKFPADGAGRLYAYVHWFGIEMVRGFAGGYGYDKRSAAAASAAEKIPALARCKNLDEDSLAYARALEQGLGAFLSALDDRGGQTWERKLEEAGFTVWQAV